MWRTACRSVSDSHLSSLTDYSGISGAILQWITVLVEEGQQSFISLSIQLSSTHFRRCSHGGVGADSLSEALMSRSLSAEFEKPVCPTQGRVGSRTDSSIGTQMLAGEARKQMCLWCASDAIQAMFKQPDGAAVFSEPTDPLPLQVLGHRHAGYSC